MNKYNILKQYFGYTDFRYGQAELIDSILLNRDVLGIMPTGAGKSVCYQLPALILQGITLVISPLISLMKDQVEALAQSGVKAAYINSFLTAPQCMKILQQAVNGEYKIIYVAPERLMSEIFLEFAERANIAMVTVDEAHCVSQWGQDFRPSYLKIMEFIKRLSYRPIISAYTATATAQVREDIVDILRLENPFVITTGFDRKNLSFSVQKPKDKPAALLKILNNNKNKSGIIYCSTRKNVEFVCESLNEKGFSATRYHAGLGDIERHNNQDDFLYDRKPLMVATNAFGMGIDKSNVSFVVHYNMPKNLESYYQEAGRAGRDGEPAECVLLYSGQDVRMNQFLIENSQGFNEDLTEEMRHAIKKKDTELLKVMTFYCATTDCLRAYIIRYFGENAPNYCGNCSNCNTHFETADITIEAQKIVSCVFRIAQRNRSFGKGMISDILRGSKNEKVVQAGMDKLTTYGIMTDVSAHRIHNITDYLIENRYLMMTGDKFPTVTLAARSDEIIRQKKKVEMKLPKDIRPDKTQKTSKEYTVEDGLFDELKALRNRLATAARVPAYIVFTDASLRDMCRKLPRSDEEFLDISGVGRAKMEQYGEKFTTVIRSHMEKHPDIQTESTDEEPENYRDKAAQKKSHGGV